MIPITQSRRGCPAVGVVFKNSRYRKRANKTKNLASNNFRSATEVSELVTLDMQLFLQYSFRSIS